MPAEQRRTAAAAILLAALQPVYGQTWHVEGATRRAPVRAPAGAKQIRVAIPAGARPGELRLVDEAGAALPYWVETIEANGRKAAAESRALHYAFPRMVRAGNGDLLLFYRAGLTHVSDYSSVVMRRSSDGGQTWSEEQLIHQDPQKTHSATNTVALVTPSGRVLNWLSSYGFALKPATRDPTFWRWSDDHGRTWSEARLFDAHRGRSTYYVTDAIATAGGLLACAATFPAGGVGNCWAALWHSGDGGRTWTHRADITSPKENRGDEVALLETEPGRILCLLRARQRPDNPHNRGLYQFRSADNGATWREDGNLWPQLNCTLQRPFLTRLDAQTVLLTGRDFEGKLIVAYVSRDNARTFGERLVIDSYVRDGGYTSAVRIAPGAALMAYYTDIDSLPLRADIKTVHIKVERRPRFLRALLSGGNAPRRIWIYYGGTGVRSAEDRMQARLDWTAPPVTVTPGPPEIRR